MKRQRIYRWWPLLLMLAWGAFVFVHPFDDDEFQHANFAWLISEGQRPFVDFFEHHFPAWHAVTAPLFWVGAAPWLLFVVRLLNAGCGLAVLYVIVRTARRLGAGKAAAAMAAVLLAAVPMFLFKMSEVRPEPPAVLLLSLATWWMLEPEAFRLRIPREFAAGFAIGLAVLFSFKYIFPAAGVAAAWIVLNRGKGLPRFMAGGLLPPLLMFAVMAGMGIFVPAIEAVVLLALDWRYRFSPSGYLLEAFETAGLLLALGITGITVLVGGSAEKLRREGAALTLISGGALAGILLVPVPHRQTFLPMFPPLAVAAAVLLQRFAEAFSNRKHAVAAGVMLLAGGLLPAADALTRNLEHSPREDLALIRRVEAIAPGAVFDGRRLLFYRPHIGRHACMHDEILAMIDHDKYANEVTSGLIAASFPPVIYDYRVKNMPPAILHFIDEHYVPLDDSGIYVPGIRLDRAAFAGGEVLVTLPVSGVYRIDWRGGGVYLNDKPVEQGEFIKLTGGEHAVRAVGFVDRFGITLMEYLP